MYKIFKISFLFIVILTQVASAKINRPSTVHQVFLKGTEYELHVYRIYGRLDGPTMLIVGGIQGDEPGGYLSADLYSGLTLEKGNLIVVPRANFKSIILYNRGPDGDMNRQFPKKIVKTKMDIVVKILEQLMGEADVFLHLHEGWGYHSPVYISKNRNPKRFGESIIVDTDTYQCKNGKTLHLKKIAMEVLNKINKKIKNKKYHLTYFNTMTNNPATPFKDMRKTATYFAVTHYCIPAFGIESSKNLPSLEMKILIHNYAINEFMKIFGIVPEQPQIIMVKPSFSYAIINVNSKPENIENKKILFINKGDRIKVTHIESNYTRGLSCDILGKGELNDLNREFEINNDTRIIFRKDNVKIGEIFVKIKKNYKKGLYVFLIKINGKRKVFLPNEKIYVKKGDTIEIERIITDAVYKKEVLVNFKGYVPPNIKNIGDDRGFKIKIDDRLIKKYSKNKEGKIYPIVATIDNIEIAKAWVVIK